MSYFGWQANLPIMETLGALLALWRLEFGD